MCVSHHMLAFLLSSLLSSFRALCPQYMQGCSMLWQCHSTQLIQMLFHLSMPVWGRWVPWETRASTQGSWMQKHSMIRGWVSHQTEPVICLPGLQDTAVGHVCTDNNTTTCWARRQQAMGFQWESSRQRVLLWKPNLTSLSLFHSFALTMAVLIIFMNAPFLRSAGFQSLAVGGVWRVPQDRSRDVSLRPFPNYPHFVKLSESTVMALLQKGSFEWQFVLWLLIYFSFSCWSHDWLLLPSPTHAVQCCSATAFLTFHCMQPHNFYCCAMLWHIGSEEKSV